MNTKDLQKKVFSYIRAHQMLSKDSRVVAGVSGGPDSVCMLLMLRDWCREYGGLLQVLHLEHGLRGEQSLEDAAFTAALCKRLGIPCAIVHKKVREEARSRGLTVEEAGRLLRYEEFARACPPGGRIAVAHNVSDQAETVLFHLVRGSGLTGLAGIRPVRGNIIRPLLSCSREEIEEWLRGRGQEWRTDATNLETDYTRNRIRRLILPELEEVNEQAVRHISEAAAGAGEASDFLDRLAQQFLDEQVRFGENRAAVNLDAFRREDPFMQALILRRTIMRLRGGRALKDVGRIHIQDLLGLAGKPRGKRLDLPGRLKAVREGRCLVLYDEGRAKDGFGIYE